jgi:hypothetical protein
MCDSARPVATAAVALRASYQLMTVALHVPVHANVSLSWLLHAMPYRAMPCCQQHPAGCAYGLVASSPQAAARGDHCIHAAQWRGAGGG